MANFEGWNRGLRGFFDLFYLPAEYRTRPGDFILHISDTPRGFYRPLRKMIDLLDPPLIIHTGDLADDLKLEFKPQLIDLYERAIRELGGVFRGANGQVIVTLGNHDNESVVRQYMKHCDVAYDGSCNFNGLAVVANHYANKLSPKNGQWALFGHDGTPDEQKGSSRWLNGQLHINLIDWRTGEVHQLCYPRHVDDSRQLRRPTAGT